MALIRRRPDVERPKIGISGTLSGVDFDVESYIVCTSMEKFRMGQSQSGQKIARVIDSLSEEDQLSRNSPDFGVLGSNAGQRECDLSLVRDL